MKQHKALSCGRFLKTEKNIRNSFFYGLSRVLHPGSNRIGVALLKYLRSLGERYLDPFFFSPGASVELLTVLPLSEKKIKKRFPAMSRFHPKMGPCFSNNQETGVRRQFFKTTSWRNGKRRWMPRPKWLHGASSRSIFSPSPIDRTKPRAGVLFSRLPIPLSTRLVCTCSTSYPVTCMLHTATIPLISTLLIKITSTSSRPPILKSWTFLVCRRIRCETSNITIWQCGQGVLTSSFFSSFLFERTPVSYTHLTLPTICSV